MADKIKDSYKQSKDIYDDVLTQNKWWSRLYIKLFWGGVDDRQIADAVLKYIPNDFSGRLLDVPVGTAVFTYGRYKRMKDADIVCLDYSEDMLEQAGRRFEENGMENIELCQGDVGNLPYKDESFDIVLSMNGFHAFPDKDKAYEEIYRVLKSEGKLIACFYIKGESKITDKLVSGILSKKGWFTPPFETKQSLICKLNEGKGYEIDDIQVRGSMVYFCAAKR